MKLTKNIVQFRKGFVNLIPNLEFSKNDNVAMSIIAELMQFGYILNDQAIGILKNAHLSDLIKFHDEVISYLKELTGSSRNYTPFWKGFPQEVMDKSECELWLHQIVHYMSNGRYEPSEIIVRRNTAFEHSSYTVIKAGDDSDYQKIFTDLVSVNQSLTPEDTEIVEFFIETEKNNLIFPAQIPFKENLMLLASKKLNVPVKTVTDVLRIAVHMSGGDISLPKVPRKMAKINAWSSTKVANPLREAFKFKKFTRGERKYILNLLENTNCDLKEFVLKSERWKRLGEKLHPGEYKTKFPKSFDLFDKIRNQKVKSWYSEVESEMKKSVINGATKLSERPGEFMRKLDSLVRKCDNYHDLDAVLNILNRIGDNVSNKVIFETYGHFEKRKTNSKRKITIKGSRKSTELPELIALKPSVITNIENSIKNVLISKFSQLEPLGKVWIDEELKKLPVPTNMRSMNAALKPIIRGQRVPTGNQNTKVIRAFVHWFDKDGTQDIDLTGTFIGMGKVSIVGWNGGHNTDYGCYSGDIRHLQGACAEYIDIDIKEALNAGFEYVVLDARNYNGGSFASIQECVFGYMEREFAKANEIFVPSTLANSVRLNSESSNTIVAAIDLKTLEYIFLDVDSDGIPVASADFEKIMDILKQYCELPNLSVYNLLELNVEARGEKVEEKDAEIKLTFNDFSESYIETLKWMGV